MCGACGQTVVADPVLGPVRTMRQHLIVAQTVNDLCRSWPGAPKVAATGGGWLVSRPTGAIEAVSTVEALWTAVLSGRAGVPLAAAVGPAAADEDSLASRVLALGRRLSRERPGGAV
ncbi:hypothetical protein ACTWLI_07865 [Arthrobacter sp. Hor0625]|uniref:hypothetical protein n=1 Tax=Arthrobacter sp. Hor0625 TaxID=3457358 RepID=UPI00403EA5F7